MSSAQKQNNSYQHLQQPPDDTPIVAVEAVRVNPESKPVAPINESKGNVNSSPSSNAIGDDDLYMVPLQDRSKPRDRQEMLCSNCHQECLTRTRTYPVCRTYAACVIAAFLAMILSFDIFWVVVLCVSPLVAPIAKQTDHYCNKCNHKIGGVPPFYNFCVQTQGYLPK